MVKKTTVTERSFSWTPRGGDSSTTINCTEDGKCWMYFLVLFGLICNFGWLLGNVCGPLKNENQFGCVFAVVALFIHFLLIFAVKKGSQCSLMSFVALECIILMMAVGDIVLFVYMKAVMGSEKRSSFYITFPAMVLIQSIITCCYAHKHRMGLKDSTTQQP